MDTSLPLIALPATVALLLKIGIFVYARFSSVRNTLAHLYMYFLLALSIQNVAEISHFYTLSQGHLPYLEFTVYYVAITIAIALLLHLAASVSFMENNRLAKWFLGGVYVYAGVLSLLFVFSKLLIVDLTPMGVTATRVPGPLYGLFELYAIAGFLGVIAILAHGSRQKHASYKKRKAAVMLLAIVPMATVIITVLVLLRLNVRITNATIINPIAIGYFLVVTAYAIHNHRLFDIQFYVPWSKVRKRKTAFYGRVRAMLAEIADLGSVREAVNRLSQTLNCPVALVGGPKPVLAVAGDASGITRFPIKELQKVEHILVANEIVDAMPEMYALMKHHQVAAIVPFHPHSEAAASWMLLGDRFSEEVYTPLDFKMVEQLFDRMSELFLDKLMLMRTQLTDAQREMRTLHQRLVGAWEELEVVRKENQALREQNSQLMDEYTNTVQSTILPAKKDSADAGEITLPVSEEKTLDDYVTEFEARIIDQVLKRCEGNKAKAARLLGLRPNTLHYKIERYRVANKKERE